MAQGVQQPMIAASTDDGTVTRYQPLGTAYTVVWQGAMRGDCSELTVDSQSGKFTGPCKGAKGLQPNTLHFVRVRQQDAAGGLVGLVGLARGLRDGLGAGNRTHDAGGVPAGGSALRRIATARLEIGWGWSLVRHAGKVIRQPAGAGRGGTHDG